MRFEGEKAVQSVVMMRMWLCQFGFFTHSMFYGLVKGT
jgi:hypothetical protein